MKRKIFSKLLAGAILVASVSSFVSCKDYDDDINDLRNQISAKSSELSKDLNDKIQTVTNTIAGLQSQVSEMDKAYKASDAALQTLISTTASGALAEAKSYADNKASETLASAKAAAESFATIQAAQAQAAAIAAAKEALAQAQAELNAALAEANATIASQGTTINGLLEADKVLTTAISAAQAKADAAYALADQANKLAETNKANIEKNASAIEALQQELTALKGSAAEIKTVVKLQSDLEAMTTKLNETAASLETTKLALASVQTDLATLKQNLETQTKILGEQIANVLTIANNNTTDIQAAKTQLTELKNSNEKAIEAINATIANLDATVAGNKEDVTKALNALKTLIQENKTAIETLLDTKIADLQALIKANADEIAANKLAADEAIAANAAAILKNAGDITTIQNAVKALQEAFGKETAATLKAYAESAASASAEGAKKYADAQDAAAKIAILEAVLALNYQNKEAVEAAINTAIAALEKTYNLATLYETIMAGDDDAKAYAKTLSEKALEDAKHWADDVRTYLNQNFTNTKDMQTQIEAAKNSAIATAYKMVIDALLNGTDKEVPTIAEEVKKQVEAFVAATTYSKADADKMVGDAIEAALKAAMVPSEPAEMGKPAVQAGLIMAAIEAASKKAADALDLYKQEQASVDEGQDGRLDAIEGFLNNTFEDKSFNSAVAALIANDQNVKTLQANYDKLSGDLASLTSFVQGEEGIASILAELKANHEQLYADVANISATIKQINALFAPTASARRAAEEAAGAGLVVATEEPVIEESDLATFFNVIKGLIENQKNNEELAATVKGEAIAAVNESLGAEVRKMLTSVTLIPDLYIDGIEAIRFQSIRYFPQVTDYSIVPENYADAEGYPQVPVTSAGTNPEYLNDFADHQLVNKAGASVVIIDNGETTAEYRLSPRTVTEDMIDVANIKMWSHKASTETRAAGLSENKPVKPEFVSLSKNGNLTVKLRKTEIGSLYFAGEGSKGTFVSLDVPRKANEAQGIEAAEIYSEFSLLDEQTIVPRIAALPWTKATDHKAADPMNFHFIDSLHIFSSLVDNNIYVKKEIDFDKPFDLLTLVTGCYGVYDEVEKVTTGHTEITKAALAKYGLAFRFALPQTYNAITYAEWKKGYTSQNYNYTDQQKFAVLNGSIIQGKLPQDEVIYGNRAIIGKEPIVRVALVDTVRGNLVDQAYFKVKFVDNKPDKPAIDVEYTMEDQELACDYNRGIMRWDKFINLVYAKLKDSDDQVTGMSWSDFRKYYPQTNVYRDNALFTDNGSYIEQITEGKGDVTIYWLGGDNESPEADANELRWWLYPADIKTIDKATRAKTFTTTVQFRSTDPKVYGPINLKLKFTIKLPTTPAIVGYNENQWFASKEKFYVQPVQYGTNNNKGERPEVVEYDFNVTQQFTVQNNWIVKNMTQDCWAWDVEFADKPNKLGYESAFAGEPNLAEEKTAINKAYKYNKGNANALQLWWMADDNHTSWTNKDSEDADNPFFILHGDKSTSGLIIPLLNDLSQKNRSDGWTPEKTFNDDKAIDMKVWVKYNQWNYEEITAFKAYLVTPVRINFTAPGAFEDNWVSGTKVDAAGNLSITDFVGYDVAKVIKKGKEGDERYKYAPKLWKYYGLEDPVFNLGDNDVIYGLKMQNGNLVVDNNIKIDETGANIIGGGMKGSQVATATAGGYTPSLTMQDGFLLYKNIQGREFEEPYNIFVPVTIKHIFGTLKTYVPFPVYPKGKAAGAGYSVIAGPEVSARKF